MPKEPAGCHQTRSLGTRVVSGKVWILSYHFISNESLRVGFMSDTLHVVHGYYIVLHPFKSLVLLYFFELQCLIIKM